MTSKKRLSADSIVCALAEDVCQQCTLRIIRYLKEMDGGLSGEDSGLSTCWEEICVQVQYETSIYWETYVETVKAFVEGEIEDMPPWHREAVWLQTDANDEWEGDDEQTRVSYPVCNSDIVDYLLDNYVWPEAGRWSNERIKTYRDRATDLDEIE